MDRAVERLRINSELVRVALAEFIGTFTLMIFGIGAVAQTVLSGGAAGSMLSINLSYGIGVMMGVYVSGGVSGGHINPAVSVAFACLGKLSLKKLGSYILAQYLGAIVASAVMYGVYIDALDNFDDGLRLTEGANATAGIFATYPQPYVSLGTGFFTELVGTMALMYLILAITDPKNMATPKGMVPVSIGLVIVVIGASMGLNSGYALNPARDMGPRIFTAMAGWGSEPFAVREYAWWWIPVIGPHVGAILGAAVYQLTVGLHWPKTLENLEHDNAAAKQANLAARKTSLLEKEETC